MTSDAADLSAARAGDRDAFTRLYDRHAGVVLSLCRRWSSPSFEAEDAMQETFLRAFRKLSQVQKPPQLRAWLYAIARRVCAERRRAAGRRNRHESRIRMKSAGDHHVQPADQAMETAEEFRLLDAALDRLPETERLAVHLYYLDPNPEQAASQAMGLSRSGFHKLLARARDHLASSMREAQRI